MREYLLTSLMEFYISLPDHAPNAQSPPRGDHSLLHHWGHSHKDWNLFSNALVHLLEVWYSNDSFPSPVAVFRREHGESGSLVQASRSSSDSLFLSRTW